MFNNKQFKKEKNRNNSNDDSKKKKHYEMCPFCRKQFLINEIQSHIDHVHPEKSTSPCRSPSLSLSLDAEPPKKKRKLNNGQSKADISMPNKNSKYSQAHSKSHSQPKSKSKTKSKSKSLSKTKSSKSNNKILDFSYSDSEDSDTIDLRKDSSCEIIEHLSALDVSNSNNIKSTDNISNNMKRCHTHSTDDESKDDVAKDNGHDKEFRGKANKKVENKNFSGCVGSWNRKEKLTIAKELANGSKANTTDKNKQEIIERKVIAGLECFNCGYSDNLLTADVCERCNRQLYQ